MTTPPHVLSVGNNPALLSSRTLVLQAAGYRVAEARTLEKAMSLLETDSIDVALICHTTPRTGQNALISAIVLKRRLMPILYIRSFAFETPPRNCIAIDNEPETLLKALRQAIRPPPVKQNVQRE
jgi:CheY-like chemotaxis protein